MKRVTRLRAENVVAIGSGYGYGSGSGSPATAAAAAPADMSNDREVWLEARKQFITASDCAALLGENPYCTREQVIMEKVGLSRDEPDHEARVRMALGTHLESGIAEAAREVFGWLDLVQVGVLVPDQVEPRLAATPDYVWTSPWGFANCQIKLTRAYHRGKSGWGVKGPPLHYQIQVQAEMACTGYQHSVLLVCHAGELSLRSYYVPRHAATIARIRAEVAKAWKEIEAWKAKL